MTRPWDTAQPFEYVIKQIQDANDFAAHANTPYTQEQIVNTAYSIVFNTGQFEDGCKKWRKRTAPLLQDWPSFKVFFAEEYNDWRDSQRNSAGAQYGSANAATDHQGFEEETIAAIANLATATAADRATTARLTETNAQLTSELKRTQEKLVIALEKIASLTTGTGARQPLRERNTNQKTRPPDRHYCWTHGYLSEHTSARCLNPAEGHQKYATARQPLGGSKIKKDDWIKRVTKIEY